MGLRYKGSKSDLSRIISLYGLKVSSVKLIKDGIINTSFVVFTNDGRKFVLRVYQDDNRRDAEINTELAVMEKLRDNGVPIPEVFKNLKGKVLNKFVDLKGNKWRAILMEFVDGHHLEASQYKLVPEFAKYQAKMHKLMSKFKSHKQRSSFERMVEWLESESKKAISKIEDNRLREEYKKISSEIIAKAKVFKKAINTLPSGLVHLDYDSNNVIVSDNHIKAILDFDDISKQPFVLDCANSLWWWLFFNPASKHDVLLSSYLKNYLTIKKLNVAERKYFPLFLRMRNATLGALLFVNLKTDLKSFKKALMLDSSFKQIKL